MAKPVIPGGFPAAAIENMRGLDRMSVQAVEALSAKNKNLPFSLEEGGFVGSTFTFIQHLGGLGDYTVVLGSGVVSETAVEWSPEELTLDITNNQISVEYNKDYGLVLETEFWNFHFSDQYTNSISNISMETNIVGLTTSDITFDVDDVYVNITGTQLMTDSYFKLAVDFLV